MVCTCAGVRYPHSSPPPPPPLPAAVAANTRAHPHVNAPAHHRTRRHPRTPTPPRTCSYTPIFNPQITAARPRSMISTILCTRCRCVYSPGCVGLPFSTQAYTDPALRAAARACHTAARVHLRDGGTTQSLRLRLQGPHPVRDPQILIKPSAQSAPCPNAAANPGMIAAGTLASRALRITPRVELGSVGSSLLHREWAHGVHAHPSTALVLP